MPAPLPPSPDLLTPRLRLRPCGEADADFLLGHWTDPDVRRHLWDEALLSRAQVRDALRASGADFLASGYGLWIVEERGEDAAAGASAGVCGLRRASWSGDPELLYSLVPARWGRGLATEAAHAVLAHAFRALGLGRVVAASSPENAASRRVLARLGLRVEREGLLDGLPALYYAMARNDFEEAPLQGPEAGAV
jgi:RimJ/RimL family protein N-acetyltransferase